MREPELKMEQAMVILTEVDIMIVADGLDDDGLLAGVASTRHELNEVRELVGISRHRSIESLLKCYPKELRAKLLGADKASERG